MPDALPVLARLPPTPGARTNPTHTSNRGRSYNTTRRGTFLLALPFSVLHAPVAAAPALPTACCFPYPSPPTPCLSKRRICSENPDIDRSERLVFIRPTIFAGFGAISFAFVCQSSSFLVYRSMSKGGVDRWASVSRWSVSIALAMGMTLALGGYWNFVDQTEGNILNNFSTEHAAASVARMFLALTMVRAGEGGGVVSGGMLDERHFVFWPPCGLAGGSDTSFAASLSSFGCFSRGRLLACVNMPTCCVTSYRLNRRDVLIVVPTENASPTLPLSVELGEMDNVNARQEAKRLPCTVCTQHTPK